MLVVLDTNVLVSGLLNGSGVPGKIVDLLLDGRIQAAYDDRILAEYEDVLARPKLHIHPANAKAVIDYIELTGRYIETHPVILDDDFDPDDLPFIEVHTYGSAAALITGNSKHFLQVKRVFTPSQFLEKYFPKG